MPTMIECPSCQRKLRVPDDLLGQQVKCPTCDTMFTAPLTGAAPAEPSAAGTHTYTPPSAPPRQRLGPPPEDVEDDYEEEYEERRYRRRRRDTVPHRGAAVLTLGILSLVILGCGFILGPIAWVMGNNDMTEIRAGRMDPEGEGLTNAGRICGIIGTLLSSTIVLFYCVIFGVGFGGFFRMFRF